MVRGMWRPFVTDDGSVTLRSPRTGALAHSRCGAWTEALERYARPTRLASRPRGARLLDVGTGLGWNLAAALSENDGLEVTGLESEAAVIETALELHRRGLLAPPPLARFYGPVASALEGALAEPGSWVPLGRGRLRLHIGDARKTLPGLGEAQFDAIFLDPFAPADDPVLWRRPFVAQLACRLAPGGILSTYSASLRVRTTLAAVGLRVGRGPRVGAKAEGTLASPDLDLPPLAPRTQRKLTRRLAQDSDYAP